GAHWNHPSTTAGFRRAEATVRERLSHFNRAATKIESLPPKREDLADPHAGENAHEHNCAARFRESGQQGANLCRSKKSFLPLCLALAGFDAVGRIAVKITGL